jgi:hypothetical protein
MLSAIPQQDAGYLDQSQVVGGLLHTRNCAAYGEHDRSKGGLTICCSGLPKTCKRVELRIILAHADCQSSQAILFSYMVEV